MPHAPLADAFASLHAPRQPDKVRLNLVETLVVAVYGVLAGADTFLEIDLWTQQKLDWFRRSLTLNKASCV